MEVGEIISEQRFQDLTVRHSSYFNNSFLRDQVKQVNNKIPNEYHWHTISIEELESVIGTFGDNIFDFLAEKKNMNDTDAMDFLDYHANKYPQRQIRNLYLDKVYDQFFDEFKIRKEEQ